MKGPLGHGPYYHPYVRFVLYIRTIWLALSSRSNQYTSVRIVQDAESFRLLRWRSSRGRLWAAVARDARRGRGLCVGHHARRPPLRRRRGGDSRRERAAEGES